MLYFEFNYTFLFSFTLFDNITIIYIENIITEEIVAKV